MATLGQYTEQELEQVVEQYSDTLLRVALHYTANLSDAEDAVQTVFLKLLNKRPAFEDEEHRKAWLIRVTINQCKDMLRSAWNRKTTKLEDTHAAPGEKGDFEVLSAVRALPEQYGTIVYLYYYEGYSTAEIAKMLEMNQNTVESRLHRARAKLREVLKGEWD